MLVSCHCSNKLSELSNKFGGFKQYKFTNLEATTLRWVRRATFLPEFLGVNQFPCLFQLVETIWIPSLQVPLSIFIANSIPPLNLSFSDLCFHYIPFSNSAFVITSPSLTLVILPPLCKYLWDYSVSSRLPWLVLRTNLARL